MKKMFQELKTYKSFYLLVILIPVLSVLLAAGIVQYGIIEKQNRYDRHLNYGYSSLEAGEYTEAITAFEEAYLIESSYDAAVGLAKAWFGSGDAEKAIQILTARSELYESTEEMDSLIEEYKITLGIYPTVIIGGKEIETNTTTIYLTDVTLTEEDKQTISQFTELVTLDLTNCGLTDIEFLRNCTKLMSVTLTENPISDFTPLYNKPDLRTLYINDTAITDYSQLHAFTSLTLLNANGNWILDADDQALRTALAGCEIYAGLNGYKIITLSFAGLEFASNATELDLSGRNISDVTPLKQLSSIRTLNLSNNRISWITPMSEIPTVTHLDLSGNRVSNISALHAMYGLNNLNMENNAVTDLSPLSGKTTLTQLNLNGNPIYHGHDALSTLTGLQKLYLQDALVKDAHLSLLTMDSLTVLDVQNNKSLTEAAVAEFAGNHPSCIVYSDFGTFNEPAEAAASAEEAVVADENITAEENSSAA